MELGARASHSVAPKYMLWRVEQVGQDVARLGAALVRLITTVRDLGTFALITLGVVIKKLGAAPDVMCPLFRHEIRRAGVRLVPMFMFLAIALGLLVIGQAVAWLTPVGAIDYLGPIVVIVVVRELGPLLTALVVLARVGAAYVVELGHTRALGEVEALEALGIDPIHYLVVPRLIGMALGIFSLTVYLILGALVSGYVWAFIQEVPLLPGQYLKQVANALSWLDFALLGLKTLGFGFVIATVTCYHGLARPLRLDEVPRATVRAVAQSLVGCVMLDALFLIIYLSA